MIIRDNFLPKKQFKEIKAVIENYHFPWYWNDQRDYDIESVKKKIGQFQLTHTFFRDSNKSNWFNLLDPIINKIQPRALIRIKANLNPYSQQLLIGEYHIDQSFDCEASIFYMNTNNGYTSFKKENEKVKSVANRLVTFKANELHLGTNCTDCKKRIVINFNYFK